MQMIMIRNYLLFLFQIVQGFLPKLFMTLVSFSIETGNTSVNSNNVHFVDFYNEIKKSEILKILPIGLKIHLLLMVIKLSQFVINEIN